MQVDQSGIKRRASLQRADCQMQIPALPPQHVGVGLVALRQADLERHLARMRFDLGREDVDRFFDALHRLIVFPEHPVDRSDLSERDGAGALHCADLPAGVEIGQHCVHPLQHSHAQRHGDAGKVLEILRNNALDGVCRYERLIEVMLGPALPLQGKPRACEGSRGQKSDRGDSRMNQAARLPALTHFLAGNFVQALAVQRCCKPRDRLLEAWIACRQMLRRMNPCQIDPQGLGLEFPRKGLWQRIRHRPVEIARLLVPGDVAAGEGDEDVLYRFAFEPETDFASDPLGTSGTRRGEQNEISCTFERAAD